MKRVGFRCRIRWVRTHADADSGGAPPWLLGRGSLILPLCLFAVATNSISASNGFAVESISPAATLESSSRTVVVSGEGFDEATMVTLLGGGAFLQARAVTEPVSGISDVEVVGRHAFVTGDSGLSVFDISEPSGPRRVGELSLPRKSAVEIVDSVAYLFGLGLDVVDIGDPTQPRLLGREPSVNTGRTLTSAHGSLSVVGSYAYLATGAESLQVVDVREPSRPVLTATIASDFGRAQPRGIAASGHYAYVTHARAGLLVLDLSDPAVPVPVGELGVPFDGNRIQIVGQRAYVTARADGFLVIDLSDPMRPRLLGRTGGGRFLHDAALAGPFAFVTDSGLAGGMHVFDVADPLQPAHLYTVSGRNRDLGDHFAGIALAGNRAVVAAALSRALEIFDVSVPDSPGLWSVLGSISAHGLAAGAGLLYAETGKGDIAIMEGGAEGSPRVLASVPSPNEYGFRDAIVARDHLLVAAAGAELLVIDVGVPETPRRVGSISLTEGLEALTTDGRQVYFSHFASVEVVSLDDPGGPRIVGSIALLRDAADEAYVDNLVAGDGHVFALMRRDGRAWIEVIDVQDPAQPRWIAELLLPIPIPYNSDIWEMALEDGLLVLTAWREGLLAIDVRRPESPSVLGRTRIPLTLFSVALSGGVAYASGAIPSWEQYSGLARVDLSNPSTPVVVGAWKSGTGRTILMNGFLHVAGGEGGLKTIRDAPSVGPAEILGAGEASLTVPAGLAPGSYDVVALSGSGAASFLRNAFQVLPDADADGFAAGPDCDDTDADVHPGASERPGDTRDENCDGVAACTPAQAWKNHGDWVSCVARACAELVPTGNQRPETCIGLARGTTRAASTGADRTR